MVFWRTILLTACIASAVAAMLAASACSRMAGDGAPPGAVLLSEGRSVVRVERKPTLVNHATEACRIEVARRSCTCVEVALPRDTIQPGEKMPFSIFLSAPQVSGERTAHVELHLIGSERSKVAFDVSVSFLDDLASEPQRVLLTDSRRRETLTVLLRRRMSSGGATPTISCATCPEWLTCKISSKPNRALIVDDIEEFRYTIEVLRAAGRDEFEERFGGLVFDAAEFGRIEVPCWLDGRRGLIVSPSAAGLSRAKLGEEVKRRFVLRASDSQPFELSSIKPSDADVTVVSRTNDARLVHVVDVVVKPSRLGEIKYDVDFKTSHPMTPTAKALITASVAQTE